MNRAPWLETAPIAAWAWLDLVRRAQAAALARLGPAPTAHPRVELASGRGWRLLRAKETAERGGPAVLLVPAPIKCAAIFDLVPGASLFARLAALGLRPFLLEWPEPAAGDDELGLEHHALAVARAAEILAQARAGPIWLLGHSLGGTLCVLAALLRPEPLRGLVLLHAPLSFAPGSSPFRDALVASAPVLTSLRGRVPGSLLGFVSASAAPGTFLFGRTADLLACAGDPGALALHLAVERWTLEERALPAALVREVLERLWREDALCRGRLELAGRRLRPEAFARPLLAVASPADAIAPPAAVAPFVSAVSRASARLLRWPFERGTVFAHLSAVLGRRAHARLWPAIAHWMRGGASAGGSPVGPTVEGAEEALGRTPQHPQEQEPQDRPTDPEEGQEKRRNAHE
ncbi:MAG: alpha/beta fold hydrolase [Geminicoccaceae bacterium]|nr:alpha/beta fold hydrolase [Geminicoccaceae bacterium]